MMERILVIGASGQIGSELTLELRKKYGNDSVYATDIKDAHIDIKESGPFHILDVLHSEKLNSHVIENEIDQVYLLAAVLSGKAESIPQKAWDINMKSLMTILNLAKDGKIKKVFWPSSIAVFGPSTPKDETPQVTITEPNTVYGISKLAGERWCEYYNAKYGTDVRSIRYPGLISYKTEPGGGTTDYAVEIFYEAIKNGKYECFLSKDTKLPMMFMPDALNATMELMEADPDKLTIRSGYNIAGFSFSPEEIANEIKKHIPGFEITYKPDFRQSIADSWPKSIDDSIARRDWGWKHSYELSKMTEIMLKEVKSKLGV
ncbi:MAG: NAD-dependent epimerase/dehydratase family protein [Ignavibacteriae bacterium]|nr:NAD-dependent epimerase/dehydratase family protein [Ignavibacteriota bacterium]